MKRLAPRELKRFTRHLDHIKQKKVMVIGDLMADKYVWGHVLRLSQEAPVPVIKVHNEEYRLGGAANAANNVRALGADVYLCGVVGYDDAAYFLRKALVEVGINTGGIFPVNDKPTTLKVRLMSSDYSQLMSRFDYESITPLAEQDRASIKKYFESYIDEVHAVILSDYQKGIFSNKEFVMELISLASQKGVLTIVDSRSLHLECYLSSTLIILDYHQAKEFLALVAYRELSDIEEIGKAVGEWLKSKALVLLRGEEEMHLFLESGKHFNYALEKKKMQTVTGLRDTMVGTLALGLLAGFSFDSAALLAVFAVNKVASKTGTATVTLEDLCEEGG